MSTAIALLLWVWLRLTSIQPAERPDLAARRTPPLISIDTLRTQIAPEANDQELAYFARVCAELDLSPFGEQIALIGRWDKRARRKVHRPQVLIAGRRVLATRTGRLIGIEGPVWSGPRNKRGELVWQEVWDDDENPPYCARTLVHVEGWITPANGTAKWSEFVQTDSDGAPTPMWRSMPSHMLGKVSESMALRRAFPEAIPTHLMPDLDPGDEAGPVDTDPELAPGPVAGPLAPATDELRNELADRLAEVTRLRPSATDELRRRWVGLFAPNPAPVVRTGRYTLDQALYLDEWLREVEDASVADDAAPAELYDDDPEAFEAGATRYDPDDGAA